MPSKKNPPVRLAVCISADENDMLTPFRVYRVLPDETAKGIDYIRVIDDEGEDYLYPAANFVFIDAAASEKRVLLNALDAEFAGVK